MFNRVASKDPPDDVAVTHAAGAAVLLHDRQVLEGAEGADHGAPDPGGVASLPVEVYVQLLPVPAQLLVHPVLETLHHRGAPAEDGVLHDFLPEVLGAFLEAGFDHLGEGLVACVGRRVPSMSLKSSSLGE